MKSTVFTVIAVVLLLATLCLMVVGLGEIVDAQQVCVELVGDGPQPIKPVNAESLPVENDYDIIVPADTRAGVIYLALIGGSQPIPNACGLTPKNPSAEWTGWGGPLDTDNATVGEGPGFRNKIVTGGIYFERGLGSHAVGTLVYDLSGDTYTRFEGWIGMSDEKDLDNEFCDDSGSGTFAFLLDGREVYRSSTVPGVFRLEHNPAPLEVAFDIPSTARELTIVMGDGGDGNRCDHSVIGDAKLLTSRVTGDGPEPVEVSSLAEAPVVDAPDPPPPVQEPVWEFQRSFKPHPDALTARFSVKDIGFRGNSQIFFGRDHRLYKWDMSARRYWWISHDVSTQAERHNNPKVDLVEVSESHDIIAYTFGRKLYLRRTSDLEFIDSAGLPGTFREYPDTLSMEPRTNYVLVSGDLPGVGGYFRGYDLWQNNSWGLNRLGYHAEAERWGKLHIDILNNDYAYAVVNNATLVEENRPRDGIDTGLHFRPSDGPILRGAERFTGAAAGQTSSGRVRIASITNQRQLFVWDWHANLLYSHQFSPSARPDPRSFQFTPNREILTWLWDWNEIVFWDVTTQKVDAVVTAGANCFSHAFSQDGKTMAVGMTDGSVHIYRWTGGSALAAPAKEAETRPTALLANYPNPFNPETWIPYQLSEPAEVSVSIYSVDGKLVRTLELGQVPAGVYSDKERAAYWDGRNAAGEPVASGVYFYTLRAGDFSATRKMVIRK